MNIHRTVSLGVLLPLVCLMLDVTSLDAKIVEVTLVFDHKFVTLMKEKSSNGFNDVRLRQEVNSSFMEVAEIFKSLNDYDLNLELRLKEIIFHPENFLNSSCVGVAECTIQNVNDWWTGTRSSSSDVTLFYASWIFGFDSVSYFNDSICTDSAIAISHIVTPVNIAYSAPRLIARLFGVDDDGIGAAASCANSKNVMDSSVNSYTQTPNAHAFSSCSAEAMKRKIDQSNTNCLSDGQNLPVSSGRRLGFYVSADEQCRRYLHRDATVFRHYYYTDQRSDICGLVHCRVPHEKQNIYGSRITKDIPPLPGLNCGQNKQCIKGECVTTDKGDPNFDVQCPFGDRPHAEWYEDCVSLNQTQCVTNAYLPGQCCQSCKRFVNLN